MTLGMLFLLLIKIPVPLLLGIRLGIPLLGIILVMLGMNMPK